MCFPFGVAASLSKSPPNWGSRHKRHPSEKKPGPSPTDLPARCLLAPGKDDAAQLHGLLASRNTPKTEGMNHQIVLHFCIQESKHVTFQEVTCKSPEVAGLQVFRFHEL